MRLYIKVGDPASATEVVEEFMKQRRHGNELEVLKRKAKIYLACQDYHHYEKVIHELVEKDEENRLDHLRELAMSSSSAVAATSPWPCCRASARSARDEAADGRRVRGRRLRPLRHEGGSSRRLRQGAWGATPGASTPTS